MMNKFTKPLFPTLYMGLTFLSVFLWVQFPIVVHFFGAASIVQSFVIAVSLENHLLARVLLMWPFVFTILLITVYFIAVFKKKHLPFVVVAGVDIALSILLGLLCVYSCDYINRNVWCVFIGCVTRALFYFYMLYDVRKYHITKNLGKS